MKNLEDTEFHDFFHEKFLFNTENNETMLENNLNYDYYYISILENALFIQQII